MSSDPTAPDETLVKVCHVSKRFPPLDSRTLVRMLMPWRMKPSTADFQALDDISFELGPGKVLGVLGKNGSGKSTLLQIVAGRMQPSSGHVDVSGPVSALLELGSGFNPDFTGRENVIFSGTLHGFSTEEMKARLEPIIKFADIGEHIDKPVKTYSSGMFARLAFSVAVSVDPTLLLVDEILSVGDISFQARCYKRIAEMKEKGTSILFVSHDLNTMQMLCDQVLLLHRGKKVLLDEPKEVTEFYRYHLTAPKRELNAEGNDESKRERGVLTNVRLEDEKGDPVQHVWSGMTYIARADFTPSEDIVDPVISLQVQTIQGVVVYDINTLSTNDHIHHLQKDRTIHIRVELQMHLSPGPFRIGFGIAVVQDDLPRPIIGSQPVGFEVISDKPSIGFTNLHSSLSIEYL